MAIGDRAIQNKGLPSYILESPPELKCAYLEELTPEDGCFTGGKRNQRFFKVHRSIVLDAGVKAASYGFVSKVSPEDIKFIQRFGKPHELFGEKPTIQLHWGKLKELTESKIKEVANAAKRLKRIIKENPCRLLEDEIRLCQSLGIQMLKSPQYVSIYLKTGRVSLQWGTNTRTRKDTIRFALLAPPNDQRKRALVLEWLKSRPEEVEQIATQLQHEGLRYHPLDKW